MIEQFLYNNIESFFNAADEETAYNKWEALFYLDADVNEFGQVYNALYFLDYIRYLCGDMADQTIYSNADEAYSRVKAIWDTWDTLGTHEVWNVD